MAAETVQHGAHWRRYSECKWGDLIEGTKAQLQALGIGVGAAFPGEPGAPKKRVEAHDPFGHPVEIRIGWGTRPGEFLAFRHFKNWPEHPDHVRSNRVDSHPGVKYRWCGDWGDEYVGQPSSLIAAGLVREDQLPGLPGLPKTSLSILADGTVARGIARGAGARHIQRTSPSIFCVRIHVSEDEEKRRKAVRCEMVAAWERRVASLPRPARLQPGVTAPRAHLRLVWSAPA